MFRLLFGTAILFLAIVSICAETPRKNDCTNPHFLLSKKSCLCGEVLIASGDIGIVPELFGLDDRLDVVLRDKSGKSLESQQMSYKHDRNFCFSRKPKGRYEIAFVLYQSGKPQPAAVFPIKYTAKEDSNVCNAMYLVPPDCGP